MKRSIFLRELRVGLLQELVAAGLVLGVLAVAGWLAVSVFGQPLEEMGDALSASLVVLITLLAFSSGARTFTAESRRRQELFFCILPISRTALWLSMVAGRLAAALSLATLLLLAGFSFPGDSPDLLRDLGAEELTLYLTLFASGCCFPLLFRRDAAAYLAAVLIFLLLALVFPLLGSFSGFLLELLWTISAHLLSAAFLMLSWLFFQWGESRTRKRQLTNLMLLGLTLAVSFLLVGTVTQSPLLDRFAGPWTQGQSPEPQSPLQKWASTARLVSPGGRYLAVVEGLNLRPGVSRVTIVETATGRRIGKHRWRGFRWVSWDARNEVLRILDRASWFSVTVGSVSTRLGSDWILLTPEGRELTRHRSEPILAALSLQDGSDLLIDSNSRALLVRWGSPKDFRVLAKVPEVSTIDPWSGQGAIVTHLSDIRMVRQVRDGFARPAIDVGVFLEPYLLFLREIEERSGQSLLTQGSKDRLIKKPIFGGVSLPDKLALYLPKDGSGARVHLFDGSLGREIPLPACAIGPAAAPELIPTSNSLAFLVRYQCHDYAASGQDLQRRHFYYLPGSGSVKPFPALDPVLDDSSILLAYLDERTAIWRPKGGETWKILRDGQIRTLWPPQTPLD
jgi:ABC-type transport system involved in multi-copper enzyme maturation permease subunit